MPSIDDLLDAEAARWRADVDARFAATTFDLEPAGPRPSRRQVWGVSALGAAAAAAAITLAITNGPPGIGGSPLAGPTPERSRHLSGGGGGSASCAGPTLSLRDAEGRRHFRPVLTSDHPVRPGRSVVVYGYFFLRTCNDTGQGGPERPERSVRLFLRTSDGQRRLALVAHPAGQLGEFRVRVTIPADAAPGPATISFGQHYGAVQFAVTSS